MLYREVLSEWLETKRLEIRKSSIHNYQQGIDNWIIPRLGDNPVNSLKKDDLQKFILDFSKNHKRNTVINITKPISASLKWAEEKGYVAVNPWKDIKIPQDFSEKEITVFTQEEIKKLLAVSNKNKKDMITIAYRTGMRIGEILTLKWSDVNLEGSFLMVRRTLSGYGNGFVEITAPKTKRSTRRIELDQITVKMLQNRRSEKNEYVFSKADGNIYTRQYINLPSICRKVEIQPRGFHTLRHTHATILLASGIHPKVVQERLGHATINTTLDTYSHIIPGMQKAAVDILNRIE